jgi:hypothetical protein
MTETAKNVLNQTKWYLAAKRREKTYEKVFEIYIEMSTKDVVHWSALNA